MRKAKICIRARSSPTSLAFIDRVTGHTTVRYITLGQAHDIFKLNFQGHQYTQCPGILVEVLLISCITGLSGANHNC